MQILLDEERHRRVVTVARRRGVSVAAVIREAIDRGIADPEGARQAAARRLLDAEPAPVPDVDDLLDELDDLRGRHQQ